MKIEFFAGAQPHYVNHLAPIWWAMPEEHRGNFTVLRGNPSEQRAKQLSIPYTYFRGQYRPDVLVCVASFEDYRSTKPARVIFVNHGVGQTYTGDQKTASLGSYSGGAGRDRVVVFLCTSERDARRNRETYPDTPAYPVGVPYLDAFLRTSSELSGKRSELITRNIRPATVAMSFHPNIKACPETRWAVDWSKDAIRALAANNKKLNLLGHSHPRAIRQLSLFWKQIGIPFEADWWKVLRLADCYVIDNSSSGYEAAALGIPTVWWNPPHYRREVHHGLRFWDAIPGVEVNDPFEIEAAIELALNPTPELLRKRDAALSIAYGDANGDSLVDGKATQRAVEACLTTVCEMSPARS